MARYKRYAEDLIGDWETSQYEPQRQVAQSIYSTNLSKLSNSLNDLKDKLARNFQNAQLDYSNTLNDIQGQSFNRLRNADIDLANRGLSTSGVRDLVEQADIQRKGQDVDKALTDLMNVNKASAEGLTEGVLNYSEGQTKLAGELAEDLGKITDQEAGNAQQYANLIAGIANNAAGRAASRARSGSGSKTKEEKEADELKRRMMIADTLSSTEFTDEEKVRNLINYLDIPEQTARQAVQSYIDNQKIEADTAKINNLQNKIKDYDRYNTAWTKITTNPIVNLVSPSSYLHSNVLNVPYRLRENAKENLTKTQNELNNLTYTDIYNLLYGKK